MNYEKICNLLDKYRDEKLKRFTFICDKLQHFYSNLRESLKRYKKAVEIVTKMEENIMNLKDYLLKNENKEILIDLIENFNEFLEYVKKNNKCYEKFNKEELDKIVNNRNNSVKYELRKAVMFKFIEKLENNDFIKNSQLLIEDDDFKRGGRCKPLKLYKKEWIVDKIDNNEPILFFANEFGQYDYMHIYYGIKKYNEQYPYNNKEINRYPKLEKIKYFNDGLNTSDLWVFWKKFDSYYSEMWKKEFYVDILKNGIENIANYYVEIFINFVKKNIDLVDEFVNEYKMKL